MGFGAEAEFCVKGEGLSLGQNVRDKARVEVGVEGTYVERGIEAEDDLRAIALGQNPTDVLINQSLIEQEPSAHQLKFGFDEVDKEGGYRQRASKNDRREGMEEGVKLSTRDCLGGSKGKLQRRSHFPKNLLEPLWTNQASTHR
ncbi:hypothetical protein AGOR_G00087080 [Albula goreensis]|uniref:Uncharacterized protein n=1 Tax=Albula goreensis TaxID=1534307 RepID=A0A8T3DSL3_9TELE|nr:hypothetical protein AGOR_G00087080 [Albula goreensis]